MLGIVFSDVAAYFVGKKLGRTPLIWVSGLRGSAPNAVPTRLAPPWACETANS